MPGDLPLNILVVEDERDTRSNLRDILELDRHRSRIRSRAIRTRTTSSPVAPRAIPIHHRG
jgi:DNA-binding NtrC family response regulator